jgi:hypothetical protein
MAKCNRSKIAPWIAAAGAVALATLVIGTAPAAAQAKSADEQSRQVLRAYGDCIVAKQRPLATQFVLDRSTLGLDRKYRSLAESICVADGAESYLDARMMRFAIAEALLRGELDRIDPAQLAAAPRLQLPVIRTADYEPAKEKQYTVDELKALDSQRAQDQASLVSYRFGECVVRTAPQNARALLQTQQASDSESQAIQSLMPALGACLEKGAQLKLDRSALRGAIALGYYSLAHANGASQVAAAGRQP